MNLEYTVLGFLSWKSFSGYDLKKIITGSEIHYWSGNNNQIYRTLLKLDQDGYVTKDILHQEKNPSKKIYTITNSGRKRLEQLAGTSPELPQIRNTFLIQLQWAGVLEKEELLKLICSYEEEVIAGKQMFEEKLKRGNLRPDRTSVEMIIWDSLDQRVLTQYEQEISWITRLKKDIS